MHVTAHRSPPTTPYIDHRGRGARPDDYVTDSEGDDEGSDADGGYSSALEGDAMQPWCAFASRTEGDQRAARAVGCMRWRRERICDALQRRSCAHEVDARMHVQYTCACEGPLHFGHLAIRDHATALA